MASSNTPRNPFLSEEDQAPPAPPKRSPEPARAPTPSSPVPTTSQSNRPTFSGLTQTAGSAPTEKKSRRFLPWIVALFVILLVGGGIFLWLRKRPVVTPSAPVTEIPTPKETRTTDEVPSENVSVSGHSEYSSENFKVGEIAVGGEAVFLSSEEDIGPLEISNIRGEAFTEKNKQEVKLVVTWTTNRLSRADINYAKGVGQSGKTVPEEDYSFNHSVIISGLDPASTYLYTIKGQDRFGNTVTSEAHAVFTGARSVSLFDLIAGAIGEVFGWAVNK